MFCVFALLALLLRLLAEVLLLEALLLVKILFPELVFAVCVFPELVFAVCVFPELVFAVCVFEAELLFLVKMLLDTGFELELLLKILPVVTALFSFNC